MIHCRDCKHWSTQTRRTEEEECPRDLPPGREWWYGVCPVLPGRIDVVIHGNAVLDYIETDANFACTLGEKR